jgi:NADH:ubiquinone oxidoreductase subunit E
MVLFMLWMSREVVIIDVCAIEPRFYALDLAIRQFQFRQDALIELLHKAQELFGIWKKMC